MKMTYKTEYPVRALIDTLNIGLQRAGENNPLCCCLVSGMPVNYWLCEIGKLAVYKHNKDAQLYLLELVLTSRNENCRALAAEWLVQIKYLRYGMSLYLGLLQKVTQIKRNILSLIYKMYPSL